MSSYPYKRTLIIGATSGIGEALAATMIENSATNVIAVGRRELNINQFIKKFGTDRASGVTFDITNLKAIPAFAKDIIQTYPDLDCVVLNSGIQREIDLGNPESLDLDVFESETTTNYTSYLHLYKYLAPHLIKHSSPTAIVFVTSGLALYPLIRCPNYCALKAALHHLIPVIREELKDKNVKVIELMPPAVQTNLWDQKFGMPLATFTEEAWKGINEGKDSIPVGDAAEWWNKLEPAREEIYRPRWEMIKKMMAQRQESQK